MFAVAAVGGILGAIAAPYLQARLAPNTPVITMGWVATVAFTALAWINQPILAGALLGCIVFTAAQANAMLSATQIHRTPGHLQGRVIAAAFPIAGVAAPLAYRPPEPSSTLPAKPQHSSRLPLSRA